MSSKSKKGVKSTSTNVAMDQRMVLEKGNMIKDSLIQSNDPEIIAAALRPLLAAWDMQTKSGSLNLVELAKLTQKLNDQVSKSQIKISENAAKQLQIGLSSFEELLKANKLTVDLVSDVADRSFDLSDKALDVVADVQTADFADLSKSIMLFAVAALAITAWAVKGTN